MRKFKVGPYFITLYLSIYVYDAPPPVLTRLINVEEERSFKISHIPHNTEHRHTIHTTHTTQHRAQTHNTHHNYHTTQSTDTQYTPHIPHNTEYTNTPHIPHKQSTYPHTNHTIHTHNTEHSYTHLTIQTHNM